MSNNLHLLFFAKKSRSTNRNTIPIYLRVTIHGKRMEVIANRFVSPNQWSSTQGMVKGNSKEGTDINAHLDFLRYQVYEYQQKILKEGKPLTTHTLREKWFAIGEKKYTLMETIALHNEDMKSLIGKDFKKSTLIKYKTTEKHVEEFIHWKYNCMDILLVDLKAEFSFSFRIIFSL
jgi:hypothetical protein